MRWYKDSLPGKINCMGEDILSSNPKTEELGKSKAGVSWMELAIPFLIMAVVLVVDQLSKAIVESWLPLNASWAPIPSISSLFRLSHVANTGAAFGLFPTGSTLFALVAVGVSIFIVIYNFRLPAHNMAYRIALGLMLGGALGNLIDRLRQDHVTDFFDFGPWPVFNVADLCIVSGVILMAVLMLRDEWQGVQAERQKQPPETTVDTDQSESIEEPSSIMND
jgi:signal peptidase II